MLGISGTELIIILFFGFLIFGPEKLPQMGRTVGRAIRQFRNASETASKKFKEEVADPFQEAVAPYKDQVEEVSKPLQEDISAINDTLRETTSMVTDPFKDVFKPTKKDEDTSVKKAGAVIAGGAATQTVAEKPAPAAAAPEQESKDTGGESVGDDPFADVLPQQESEKDTPPAGDAKPILETGGTVKKSLAASLYELDDEESGE